MNTTWIGTEPTNPPMKTIDLIPLCHLLDHHFWSSVLSSKQSRISKSDIKIILNASKLEKTCMDNLLSAECRARNSIKEFRDLYRHEIAEMHLSNDGAFPEKACKDRDRSLFFVFSRANLPQHQMKNSRTTPMKYGLLPMASLWRTYPN